MKKRIFALATAILLVCSMALSVSAVSPEIYQDYEVIHTEEGDFEIETTLTIYPSVARSNTKTADKSQTVKQSGTVVAEVTLSATFGYDGKSAWVEEATGSHTTYEGWSYKSESITTSGNTANLTAKLTKLLNSNLPISISIKCTADGVIS